MGSSFTRKEKVILIPSEISHKANYSFIEVTSLNNIFYEMIFKRKSFHIFRNVGNESISKDELNDIQSVYSEFTPLNPGIKTAIRIVPEKQTNCERGGEYCVLLYSEKKDGYLQNIGYLGEQLDLYRNSTRIALSLTVFMFPARSDGVGSDGVWLKLLLIMQEAAGLLPCTHPAVLLRKPLLFTRQWASD